ncbi:AIPR family protein [Bacillaceae bacterium S4-13-58]
MSVIKLRETLMEDLFFAVKEEMNYSGLDSEDQAFNRVIANWLGYELDEDSFVDGKGDRGIDFWTASDNTYDICQIKTHRTTEEGNLNLAPFDVDGVLDLNRIKTLLLDKEGININNRKLEIFNQRWQHTISSKRLIDENDTPTPINVNLYLIVVGNGLTEAANDEFEAFKRTIKDQVVYTKNVIIQFRAVLYTIEDIIKKKWREENRAWRNNSGIKKNSVKLYPEKSDQWISSNKSAVFYCRAIDLVHAYQEFGYQIFEPNVRCNIKKSSVNSKIRESIKSTASRKDFRYLNNGVTIICQSYSTPKEPNGKTKNESNFFKVIKPGIVNGLQTVVSMHDAYYDLNEEEKKDFEQNCYVLVRLLNENAVKDPDRVVQATNTQNHMQQRNLVSNQPEQILLEKKFAELGWFYERKQDAWFAFSMDPKRWRSLPNKRKEDFMAKPAERRTKPRKIDNIEIAQSWLSFIGYSDMAVQEKSQIFENMKRYELVFLKRPSKHGLQYEYQFSKSLDESKNSIPTAQIMLIAYIARVFAREITPSSRENREKIMNKMGLDKVIMTKEEIDAELSKNNEYLYGLALNGMSFLFVEYLGYVLFRSFGKDLYKYGGELLNNGSFKHINENNR